MLASQLCTYKAIMTLFGISSGTYGDLLCSFQSVLTLFWIALKSFPTTHKNVNTCGLCLGSCDSRRVQPTATEQLLADPCPQGPVGFQWEEMALVLGGGYDNVLQSKTALNRPPVPQDPHCLAEHTKWFLFISIQSCPILSCLVPLSGGLHNDPIIDH